MKINSKYLDKLSEYYSNNSGIVLVSGEKGLLKSTTINEFLLDKKFVIKISKHLGSYSLETIYDAFFLFMKNNVKKYEKQYKLVRQLSLYEKLKALLNFICGNFSPILYFDSLNNQNDSVWEFVYDIILNLQTYKNKPFLIAEVDTTSDTNSRVNDLLQKTFYTRSNIEYIKFTNYQAEELKQLLSEIYTRIVCPKETLNYILGNCYGNPEILTIAINILREKNYIKNENGSVIIDTVPEGLLYDELKNYICRKFEKLNEQEQNVLKSSASVGITFDSLILNTVFNIMEAKELLSEIEESSQLVVQEQNDSYSFKTSDVYKYVDKTVSRTTKLDHHKKLSTYFYSLLKPNARANNHRVYIKNLFSYVRHAICAEQFMEAKYKLIELIDFYQSINDLSKALEIIEFVLPFYETHDKKIYVHLNFTKSDILYSSGKYPEALKTLEILNANVQPTSAEAYCVQYKKADALLMLEHTNSAESIMLGLEKAILDNRKNFCEHFEMQVYRSLASLYDFVNDAPKTIVYFNKSLKLSAHLKADDYLYSLYRQSSICSPLNEARSLMDIAYKKFVEKNNLIEIAKCAHNISTDALYLNNPSDCEKYAEISLKTFERYGSLEKVSTLNTLAIYYAIYQQDTKKAKSTLQSALKIANSDWVKITVLNNLNTVAVMENDEEESLKYVKQIETLYRNEMPVARNYVDFSYALYFKLIGNSDEAKNRLTSIINYEKSEYRHKTLAALFYNDLSMNKLHITVDHEIYGYLKKCHDANSFWGTVRFWET